MLSKLHYFATNNEVSIDMGLLMSILTTKLQSKHNHVRVESCRPGGTLGLFFYAVVDGQRKFVKTHLPGGFHRENLVKEISIISILYSDVLTIERLDCSVDADTHVFLVMDQLEAMREQPSVATIKEITNSHKKKLSKFSRSGQDIVTRYTFFQLCEEAVRAIKYLFNHELISRDTSTRSIECIEVLRSKPLPLYLGHGDLSNKNIMMKGERPVVIDWEDAMWTIENYDLYYWLTFFDQRRFYSVEQLSRYNIDITECVSCMVTVTILKCYLSYLNGTYKNNSSSFDQRLQEMLCLLDGN